MFYYVDESGNTGQHLFDEAQPMLYYGVLGCRYDLDTKAEPLLAELRAELGVDRIHANQLGVGRLTPIAKRLIDFSKKDGIRFSLFKVKKRDHAVITFFDQVFDSGLNEAVAWQHYWTPLRYALLLKVAYLFDEELAKRAWSARREQNQQRCDDELVRLCHDLNDRLVRLPDARSRELIGGALSWAMANPRKIDFGTDNRESALQISPNLIGFQQVLHGISVQSLGMGRKVKRIIVDRQTEFNTAQGELAEIYQKLRGHKTEMGPGMPTFDYSHIPDVPPTFKAGDDSAGLELVDVTLWIAKRLAEKKPLSPELEMLFQVQTRRGITDEVSLDAIDHRWRHLAYLPVPEKPIPAELEKLLNEGEEKRRAAVAGLAPALADK